MRYLIVGESGLLGATFVQHIGSAGYILDRSWSTVPYDELTKLIPMGGEPFQYILHCADESQRNIFATNKNMMDRILFLQKMHPSCRNARIIYFSSLQAYDYEISMFGDGDVMGKLVPPHTSEYGTSKMFCCQYLQEFGKDHTIFVLGNVFGPHDHSKRIISTMIQSALTSHRIDLKTSGHEQRTFVYSVDLVKWIFMLLQNGTSLLPEYFVGTSVNTHSILDMASYIINCIPNTRVSTSTDVVSDRIIKFGHELIPFTPYEVSIDQTVQYFRNIIS